MTTPIITRISRCLFKIVAFNSTFVFILAGLNLQKLCTQAISSFVPSEDVDELPLPKRMKLMISSDNDS